MNQKKAVQPRVNFHCLLGVNSAPVNREPWGRAWRGGHSRSWRYYLLSGLLMRCSVWKQARDLLSAWLLRPPQETGWLVMYVRRWPFCCFACQPQHLEFIRFASASLKYSDFLEWLQLVVSLSSFCPLSFSSAVFQDTSVKGARRRVTSPRAWQLSRPELWGSWGYCGGWAVIGFFRLDLFIYKAVQCPQRIKSIQADLFPVCSLSE